MTPDRWDLLTEWLNEWLTADPDGRARLRERLAAEHPDLLGEAEALAQASGALQGFLETPALVLEAPLVAAEDPGLPAGTPIGPYQITSLLARGGTGDVYRATDTRLHRDIALKVLASDRTVDPQRVERFIREARVTASLDHENIVRVYDVGRAGEHAYLVAELLEGETLRARVARGAMPVDEVLRAARGIASGLAAAHEAGLVHRDLKPDNIFLTRSGAVKILDFGIAKLMPEANARDQSLTMTGVVLGTAGYLAPEQIRGGPVDARADLFSLGAVLFEMLTGRRAFERPHLVETLHAILHDPPSDALAAREDVPAILVRTVMRLLEPEPEARFQSATEALAALHGVGTLSPEDPRAPPASPSEKAQEKYRLGRVAVRRPTRDDLRNAAKYFEEAIALDPEYADAWAGLASAYKRLPMAGGAPPAVTFEKARPRRARHSPSSRRMPRPSPPWAPSPSGTTGTTIAPRPCWSAP
jgi:serine/threonine protein kinase